MKEFTAVIYVKKLILDVSIVFDVHNNIHCLLNFYERMSGITQIIFEDKGRV